MLRTMDVLFHSQVSTGERLQPRMWAEVLDRLASVSQTL